MTPAISVVQQAGLRYALHRYEAVEPRRWDAAHVLKTLVVSVDGDLQVACVPVSAQLDLVRLTGARVHPIASAP